MDNIELEGMDSLTDLFKDMTLTEENKKQAMQKAIKVVKNEISKNTTKRTGRLSKLSATVKQEDFATVGIVKTKRFYDIFEEFGTSNAKHNVGYFDKSVRNKENEAVHILYDELIDKAVK